jgi:hypothetical protein
MDGGFAKANQESILQASRLRSRKNQGRAGGTPVGNLQRRLEEKVGNE